MQIMTIKDKKKQENELQESAMQDGTNEKDTPGLRRISKAPVLVIITQIPRSRDTSVSSESTLLQRSSRDRASTEVIMESWFSEIKRAGSDEASGNTEHSRN